MTFNNMLVIPDGAPETFFGVMVIICITVLIYTLAFAELQKKKTRILKLAKIAAIEGLNRRKLEEQRNTEDSDEYED